MGYYTGDGTTSGGGSSVSVFWTGWGAYPDTSMHTVYQRTESSTNVKNGVSLETAQEAHGDSDMQSHSFDGGLPIPAAKGSRSSAQYSQINGSNLYALSVTTETVAVKLDNGSWNS